MRLRLVVAGALVTSLALGQAASNGPAYTPNIVGSLVVGAPTGGNQGTGSINAQSIFVNGVAVGTGSGTVTGVTLNSAGGIFSVGGSPCASGACVFTESVAGTSGGIPYFSSTSALSSSTLLAAGSVVLGGGAGTAPTGLADVATGSVLISGGVGANPSYSTTPTFAGTNLTGTGASFTAGNATLAANLSGTPALPNGTTATTQAAGDATTKIATDAFVNTIFAVPPVYGSTTANTVHASTLTSVPAATPTADAGNVGFTAAQGAVPMILVSSGTIGNNGALSAITAITQYANCYMYFPVNTIAAGVAAGFYFVQMSSTTAGTIFNNLYVSGTPTIPVSPTAFSTTGPGAYTQTTGAALTAFTISIPGNTLGVNGVLEIFGASITPNNANNKIIALKYGGTAFNTLTATTAATDGQTYARIANIGSASSQISMKWGTQAAAAGFVTGGNVTGSVNSANAQSAVITLQLATATDYIVLESYHARVFPN